MTPAKVKMSDLNDAMKVAIVEHTLRRVLPQHIGVSVSAGPPLPPHVLLVAQVACAIPFNADEWATLTLEMIYKKADDALHAMRMVDCTKPPRGDKT